MVKELIDDIVFVFSGLRTSDILTILFMGIAEIGVVIFVIGMI